MYTLEGVSSVANVITAYEESNLNRDSYFLICYVFFVSKGSLFDVYCIVKSSKCNKIVLRKLIKSIHNKDKMSNVQTDRHGSK